MRCGRAAKLISFGVLDSKADELEMLRKHALHCSECARELQAYDRLMLGFATVEQCEIPEDLHGRLLASALPVQVACDDVKPLLSAYNDEELSFMEADCVRAHLTVCETCRAEYEYLKMVLLEMQTFEIFDPPARVSRNILEKTKAQKTSWTPGLGWNINRAWRYAGVAAVLAFFGTIYVFVPRITVNNPVETASNLANIVEPPSIEYKISIKKDNGETKNNNVVSDIKNGISDIHGTRYFSLAATSEKNWKTIKINAKHRTLDTAKAVTSVVRKNKKQENHINGIENSPIIPKAEDVRYQLVENEPVKIKSEPEIVASAANYNVNNEYDGDDVLYFAKVAEKVQSLNRIDEWMDRSKSLTDDVRFSSKSGNIPLIGFRF